YGAEISKAGTLVVGTMKEGARIYAAKTGSLAAKLTLPGGLGSFGYTQNNAGTMGVTCGRDYKVTLWDLKKRTRIVALSGHTDYVMNAAFSPNGRLLATA